MTFLVNADIWSLYCSELEAQEMPLRETAQAYLQMITNSAKRELAARSAQGEGWRGESWEFAPKNYDSYHWITWVAPPLSADIIIPFVRSVSALGYDPSGLATHHFREALHTLSSLPRPDIEPAKVFDIPINYDAPDLDRTHPRDAFDVPPKAGLSKAFDIPMNYDVPDLKNTHPRDAFDTPPEHFTPSTKKGQPKSP